MTKTDLAKLRPAAPTERQKAALDELVQIGEAMGEYDSERMPIPSPSAICGLIGCKRSEPHEHVVLEQVEPKGRHMTPAERDAMNRAFNASVTEVEPIGCPTPGACSCPPVKSEGDHPEPPYDPPDSP